MCACVRVCTCLVERLERVALIKRCSLGQKPLDGSIGKEWKTIENGDDDDDHVADAVKRKCVFVLVGQKCYNVFSYIFNSSIMIGG